MKKTKAKSKNPPADSVPSFLTENFLYTLRDAESFITLLKNFKLSGNSSLIIELEDPEKLFSTLVIPARVPVITAESGTTIQPKKIYLIPPGSNYTVSDSVITLKVKKTDRRKKRNTIEPEAALPLLTEKRFRALIENGADAVVIFDGAGTLTYVSPAIERVLGYSEEDAIKLRIEDIVHPDDAAGVAKAFSESLAKPGIPVPGADARLKHKNGNWRWYSATITNLLDDPAVNGIVDNFRDITEKKLAEQKLHDTLAILHGRIKQKNCLANLASLGMSDLSLEQLFEKAVYIMLPAFDYLGSAGTKVEYGGLSAETPGFKDCTDFFFTHRITADNRRLTISVGYTAKDEEPYLKGLVEDPILESFVQSLSLMINQKIYFEEMRKNQNRLTAIVESEPECVKIVDKHGTLIEMNPAGFGMLEIDENPRQFLGTKILRVIHPEDKAIFSKLHEDALKGVKGTAKFRIIGVKGAVKHVESSSVPLLDENGDVSGVLSVTRDITEKVLSEQAEKTTAMRMELLLKSTGEGIFGIDEKGNCTFINPAGASMLGYQEKDIIGKNTHSLIHHTKSSGLPFHEDECPIYKSKSEGKSIIIDEDIFYKSDGTPITVRISSSPIYYDGKITGAVIAFKDITERKKREIEIIRLQRNQEALINGTLDFIWSVDNDFKIISCNKAYGNSIKMVTGREVNEGDPVFIEEFGEELNKKWREYYTRAANGENFEIRESFYNPASKRVEYGLITFSPMYNNDGIQFGVACYSKNITEDMLNQISLEQAKNRLQGIFDHSPDIICTLDQDGVCITINKAVRKILGFSEAEMIGKPIVNFAAENEKQNTRKFLESVITGDETANFEGYFNKNDLTVIPLLWSAYWNKNENRMYCIIRDITDIKNAVERLHFSEKRFKTLIQDSSDFVSILDSDMNYVYVSPASEGIMGFTWENLLSRSIIEFIHPDDAVQFKKLFDSVPRGGKKNIQSFRFIHKHGDWIWLEGVLSNLLDDKSVGGVVLNTRDVTKRVVAEKHLKESEAKYRILFKLSPLPMWVYEYETYKILDVNESAVNHYGYSYEEFLQLTIKDLRPEKEVPKLLASRTENSDRSAVIRFGVFTHQKKDGTLLRMDVSGQHLLYSGKNCMMIVCVDVTEKEQALNRLKENERKLKTALNIGKLGYWQFDLARGSLYWSDEVYKIWEMEQSTDDSKIAFRDLLFSIPEIERAPFLKRLTDARKELKNFDFEQSIHTYRDAKKSIRFKGYPIETGITSSMVFEGTVQDITEITLINNKLEEVNNRYRLVTKASFDALWDWNLQTNRVYWGEGMRVIFGYDLDDSETDLNLWAEHIHPDDKRRVLDDINDFIKGSAEKWSSEYRFIKADGSVSFVLDKAIISRDSAGNGIRLVGAMQDITRQREEYDQLRLYESIIHNTDDSVMITDGIPENENEYKIIFVNSAFTNMTGYSSEEIVGKTPKILQGPLTEPEALNEFRIALENRSSLKVTILNYKKNGEPFWNQISMNPMYDRSGKLAHYVTIAKDVTKQKYEDIQAGLIAEFSRIFTDNESLNESIRQILTVTGEMARITFSEIWVTGRTGNYLNLIARYISDGKLPAPDSELKDSEYIRFNLGEGLPGQVLEKGEALYWEDNQMLESFVRKQLRSQLQLTRIYGIPLKSGYDVVAVLLLGFDDVNFSQNIWKPFFENLSNHLAVELRRKQLESELKQLFDTAPDVICIADADGYFKRINPAACELLGYTEEELLSAPLYNFIHPDDKEKAQKGMQSLTGSSPVQYFEVRYLTKSKKIKWLAWTSTPSPDTELFYAIAKDITEKKELEYLFEKAVRLARIGTWEVDLQENKVFWSDVTKEIHEVDKNYIPNLETGINFYKEGESRDLIIKCVERGINEGVAWDEELILVTVTGKEIWVRAIGEAEVINGKCLRLYGAFQDIDLRKRAEIKIQQALLEKDTILESIGDGFIAMEFDGTVTYWNRVAERLLDIPKQEILGKVLWDILPQAVGTSFYEHYLKAKSENKDQHFVVNFNELNIWLEVSGYPARHSISIFFKDVTEKKIAEESLRISNERYRMVSDATNDIIYDWDIKTDYIFWGESFASRFGYLRTGSEATGYFKYSKIHPENQNSITESVQAAFKDTGMVNWVEEYRFQKKDGSYSYVIDRGSILRDESGAPIRMVGAMQDITHRKEYEESLKKLNEDLKKYTQELKVSNAELEQFAYVASHDLQEPLRMITGFLAQLDKKYSSVLDDKGKQYINFAVDGAKRMRQIILDLLEFSRVGRMDDKLEMVDTVEVINDVISLFKRKVEESGCQIKVGDLPQVFGSYVQIRQIFHNLIGNALKYGKKDVPPRIEISSKDKTRHWEFSVKDNGIGIDSEYFQKIFIIFQRLHNKDEFSGTGMGLAITKKIVESNGGAIWVESKENEGSTFYFTIPKRL